MQAVLLFPAFIVFALIAYALGYATGDGTTEGEGIKAEFNVGTNLAAGNRSATPSQTSGDADQTSPSNSPAIQSILTTLNNDKPNHSSFQPNQQSTARAIGLTMVPHQASDENFWASALTELEGKDRRPGLWARCFSETDGVESVAKARYLQYRTRELLEAHSAAVAEQKRIDAEIARQVEADHVADEKRKMALIENGRCPNCAALIPLNSIECSRCKVDFSYGAAWKPVPLSDDEKREILNIFSTTDSQVVRQAELEKRSAKYESLEKGHCPNCRSVIPMSSLACSTCKAIFEKGAAWNVLPLNKN